jgi:hypothetical protein
MALPQQFLSYSNFELAFTRIVRAGHKDYKRFHRHLFSSYNLALKENLGDPIKDIKGGWIMSAKEQVTRELDNLSEAELKQVAEYVAFLKFRTRLNQISTLDEAQLSALYSEFADEDRRLAEEGMSDYAKGLAKEDTP